RVAGPPGAEPTPGGPARPGPRGRRWASLGEAPGGPVCPRRGGMAVDGEGGECRGVPDPGPDRPAGVRDRLRSLGDRPERVERSVGGAVGQVTEIGLGAGGVGESEWIGAEDEESLRALHRAIDLGGTFIDTALAYGDGHSERLVGQVVRARTETVSVATKVPP